MALLDLGGIGKGRMIGKSIEKRKYKRFLANEDTLAFVKNHFSIVGQMKDASLGGLSIYHRAHGIPTKGSLEVDILVTGKGFSLLRLPAEMVWYSDASDDRFDSSISMHRLGIKFLGPSSEQIIQLKHFLKNHTKKLK
jgi:hypothetical protein